MSRAISWSEVTAFFGGTFDPPHLGHREALDGLLREPGVKRVFALPSALPPHKAGLASTQQRIEMVKLAFGADQVDLREIERGRGEPGRPTYTFDTLNEINRQIPREKLAFVIGVDQMAQLPNWHKFPDLLALSNWIVLARKPDGDSRAREFVHSLPGVGNPGSDGLSWALPGGTWLRLASTPARELSSTSIRETLARTGAPPMDSLNPAVAAYLKLHRIYGSESS